MDVVGELLADSGTLKTEAPQVLVNRRAVPDVEKGGSAAALGERFETVRHHVDEGGVVELHDIRRWLLEKVGWGRCWVTEEDGSVDRPLYLRLVEQGSLVV